jgi:hypothetical protein
MSVDKAILTQTAGKIAGEMVASMQLRNNEEVMNSFNEIFTRVLDALNFKIVETEKKTSGGRNVPIINQDIMKSRLNDALRSGSAVTTNTIKSQ